MKKSPLFSLLLIISIFFSNRAFSQGQEVTLDPAQLTVDIFPLIVHIELKLGKKNSFTLGGGLTYNLYFESGSLGRDISPFFTSSLRNYYRRKRVNKSNLRNNSGNYVGILSTYAFNTLVSVDGTIFETDLDSFSVGPVWGFQRNYASGIHLDLSIGPGFITEIHTQNDNSRSPVYIDSPFTFIGRFEFGFKFN